MTTSITSTLDPSRRIGRREFVVLMATLMSLNALSIDAMLPALDEIARAFAVEDPNRRQLVVGVYLLATGAGALVPGLFADRYGRRPVLFVGLAIYGIMALFSAIAISFESLLVARALQGFGCSALMVLPAAIIRDRFEGDAMARLTSTIFIVFMVVPTLAPTVGQAVLLVANWHWIFVLLAAMAALVGLWSWFRLPETLDPADRQPIDLRVVPRNMVRTFTTRAAVGYVFASGLTFGAVFGYITSAQQLIGEHFRAGPMFPYIFGATASTLALSSFVNSRIVEKFGARRVSHTGLVIFIVVSAMQVYVALDHASSLAWFLPLMSMNLALLGFMGANFSSIAMQPFKGHAGSASSVQAFTRMILGALVGIAIGQAYDDSALPLAVALLGCGSLAFLLVLFSERGKLWGRPSEGEEVYGEV